MGGRGAASKKGVASSSPKTSEAEARAAQAEKATRNIRFKALNWAKAQIGSLLYGRFGWNRELPWGTVKCNQFVVHAYNYPNGGYPPDGISPNDKGPILKGTPSRSLLAIGVGRDRYPSAKEIYKGRLPNFVLVKSPKLGDIAADGEHVGIVSGKAKTISASSIEHKVVENDWGFHEGKPQKNVRFYRYIGEKRTTKGKASREK